MDIYAGHGPRARAPSSYPSRDGRASHAGKATPPPLSAIARGSPPGEADSWDPLNEAVRDGLVSEPSFSGFSGPAAGFNTLPVKPPGTWYGRLGDERNCSFNAPQCESAAIALLPSRCPQCGDLIEAGCDEHYPRWLVTSLHCKDCKHSVKKGEPIWL